MFSIFYSKRLKNRKERSERNKTKRPKTFKTEKAAKEYAKEQGIKDYELENIRIDPEKRPKKIRIVPKEEK